MKLPKIKGLNKSLNLSLIGLVIILLLAAVFIFIKSQLSNLNTNSDTNNNTIMSFLVFGDSGTGGTKQKKLAQVMLNFPFDFILHTGDIAYPEGSDEQFTKNFKDIYKKHLQKAPFYPSPGNHDYLTDNLGPYLRLFNLPKQALNNNDQERYYSFDIGNTHFISLDTNSPLYEISYQNLDDMADWLIKDLTKANKSDWKIVFFHHAPYSSGKVHSGNLGVRNLLVPIFEQYKVDAVFSGHEHNFERTCLIYGNKCNENGILYIVTGGAGDNLYELGEKQYFSEFSTSQNHFVLGKIDKCTLTIEAMNIEGKKIDSYTLNKCTK